MMEKEELDEVEDEEEEEDDDEDEDEDEDDEEEEEEEEEVQPGRRRSSRVSEMENRQELEQSRRPAKSSSSRSSNKTNTRQRLSDRSTRWQGGGDMGRRSSSRNRNSASASDRRHSSGGSRRSARFVAAENNGLEGIGDSDSDEDDDDDEEEEEEEEEEGKKYSFRDRAATTRRIINIENLGGDGAGMAKSDQPKKRFEYHTGERETTVRDRNFSGGRGSSGGYNDGYDRGGRRYTDQYARYNFGGKYDPSRGARKRSRSSSGGGTRRHRGGGSGRRHYDSSSESSVSSGGDRRRGRGRGGHYSSEDEHFRKYEQRRLTKERDSVQPMMGGQSPATGGVGMDMGMGGSIGDKASAKEMVRVDAMPVAIDSRIGFESVGGLDSHVNALKEMVVLPLLYPHVFTRFDTQPPRGVLFTGPPGTGKTLTARALANSVSNAGGADGNTKVSFFMRKGADCLSKWVGEGERQLRLLFEQAKRYQPSIIFFDEIDGLAPVRSVKQDQIHASIVSTLLALMDGLDSRGQVVVIGATNRPDAIDPALRRPGRFDRELTFSLPDATARAAILDIHTGMFNRIIFIYPSKYPPSCLLFISLQPPRPNCAPPFQWEGGPDTLG
jgi:hypothetical protein